MKTNRAFISAIVLAAMVSVSCAQTANKNGASLAAAVGPELRWKYETSG